MDKKFFRPQQGDKYKIITKSKLLALLYGLNALTYILWSAYDDLSLYGYKKWSKLHCGAA